MRQEDQTVSRAIPWATGSSALARMKSRKATEFTLAIRGSMPVPPRPSTSTRLERASALLSTPISTPTSPTPSTRRHSALEEARQGGVHPRHGRDLTSAGRWRRRRTCRGDAPLFPSAYHPHHQPRQSDRQTQGEGPHLGSLSIRTARCRRDPAVSQPQGQGLPLQP